ncbi:MAG: S-layer homology domain-containing protein [Acidimicrobiia bacterium]|nr:S-layer homology domain-containing protein [Acidimicrobiia bacterium]
MARRTLTLWAITLLAVALVAPVSASHNFSDVPDGHTFHTDIAWLADVGITLGCNPPTNDMYCPGNNVTRGQMAAFLVRALELTDSGTGNYFTDDDGSVFEDDIDKLYVAGITQGCNPPTNDMYCPGNNVTRGQMAAFLNRALNEPPAMVTDVVATLSGGSGEIDVSWTGAVEPDVVTYNVWYSFEPGAAKSLLTDIYFGPAFRAPDRIYVTDFPRSLTSGKDCYQVSAVDSGGLEGPRSAEACFDSTPGPPSQVMNVTVGLGGGSGEVDVSWDPVPELDVDHYNAYFSEQPGGPYGLVLEPYFFGPDTKPGGRIFFIDWPVAQTDGESCYLISAVDLSGNEGPTSVEACFDSGG